VNEPGAARAAPPPPAPEHARAAGIPAAAALLAGSALFSRVLGFAREALLAYQVGASGSADAYYAAFQLPDLLNYLLAGGALSIAFLPLYTSVRTEAGEEAADRLLATVLGTLGAVALLVTAAMWLGAGPLVALQFPRFDPTKQALTTHLTRIVLPAQCFFVIGGILQVPLLARGRFGAAAVAPLLYNLGIITGGLVLAPRIGVEGFSWGALAGAVAGPFAIPWLDVRRRVRLGIRIAPLDRAFRRYLWVAAPLMFGQTLLTVDEWYGRWFGGLVGEGVIAHLAYARKLMQVPVAAVGQAIGVAALPTLAQLFAAGRRAELDRVVLAALRAATALGVLAAAFAFAFAGPLVRVVFRHGAFTSADATTVSVLLALFSLAVPAWVVQQIASRAFYARGDTWRPMALGTAIAVLAIPLYLSLGQAAGARGIAAAGVIGMSANALATLLLLRRVHGGPPLVPLAATVMRAAAIAALAGAAGALLRPRVPGDVGALLGLVAGGAVFAAVAVGGIAVIGDESLRAAPRRVWLRLARRAVR
jgi:putative peptidoglycan lipid II flippase